MWGGWACPIGLPKQNGTAKKGRSAVCKEDREEKVW